MQRLGRWRSILVFAQPLFASFALAPTGCESDEEKAQDLVEQWGSQYEARRDHVCGCASNDTAKNACEALWSSAIESQFNDVTRECVGEATHEAPDATLDVLRCRVAAERTMTTCVKKQVKCADDSDDNRDRYAACNATFDDDVARCPGFPVATEQAVAQCVAQGGPHEDRKQAAAATR